MRVVIACLPLVLLAVGCDTQSPPTPQPGATRPKPAASTLDRSQAGAAMPTESFTAPDGRTVTLAAFRGRPLLVNLWATWCAPCVKEMPSLDRLAARSGDTLQVLTISQDPQGASIVGPWWTKRKFARLKPYLDTENGLGFAYSGGMLPTTVLYNAQGREVWRILGDRDWDSAATDRLLAEAGQRITR